MNRTQLKVAAGLLLTAGMITTAYSQVQQTPNAAGTDVVWSRDPQVLAQQPPVVLIRPTQVARPGGAGTGMMSMSSTGGQRTIQTGVPLTDIFIYAYDLPFTMRHRIIMPPDAPQGRYDYMVTLPHGGKEATRKVLKDQFGLVGRFEMRPVDLWLLKFRTPNAPGLQASSNAGGGGGSAGSDGISASGSLMSGLANQLELVLGVPLIDQTGLAGLYDYKLTYSRGASPEAIRKAVLDQLGLELTPSPQKQPVEFFVVEKAN